MIQLDDYRDANDRIDWPAYRHAQVSAGESCRTCGHFILFSNGGPTQCGSCDSLTSDKDEVRHSDFIRCPKCKESMSVHDEMSVHDDMYRLYEDGSHEMSCQNCDHDFEIVTHVTYSFESPALIATDDEEELP